MITKTSFKNEMFMWCRGGLGIFVSYSIAFKKLKRWRHTANSQASLGLSQRHFSGESCWDWKIQERCPASSFLAQSHWNFQNNSTNIHYLIISFLFLKWWFECASLRDDFSPQFSYFRRSFLANFATLYISIKHLKKKRWKTINKRPYE